MKGKSQHSGWAIFQFLVILLSIESANHTPQGFFQDFVCVCVCVGGGGGGGGGGGRSGFVKLYTVKMKVYTAHS